MKKSSIALYGICMLAGIINCWLPQNFLFQIFYVLVVVTLAFFVSNKIKRKYESS